MDEMEKEIVELDVSDVFEEVITEEESEKPEIIVGPTEKTLNDFIERTKSSETRKKTARDVATFQIYCESVGEIVPFHLIEPVRLNVVLGSFFIGAKRKDGSEYEPESLSGIYGSVKRHLDVNGYSQNITKSDIFRPAREVLASKKRQLKAEGHGNHPNRCDPLTPEDEEAIWNSGFFDKCHPTGLRNALWFLSTKTLGLRGRQESRQLCWGDLVLKCDKDGKEFIEFKERTTKTRQGDGSTSRAFVPKMWANETDPDRCPIKLLKLYEEHRPVDTLRDDFAFYLSINHKRAPGSKMWYSRQSMGKNELSRIMKNAAAKAGIITKKITNHSVRKTTCSQLIHAGVPVNLVAQLSGHKNIQSLQSYATASLAQQHTMYDILAKGKKSFNLPLEASGPVRRRDAVDKSEQVRALPGIPEQRRMDPRPRKRPVSAALGRAPSDDEDIQPAEQQLRKRPKSNVRGSDKVEGAVVRQPLGPVTAIAASTTRPDERDDEVDSDSENGARLTQDFIDDLDSEEMTVDLVDHDDSTQGRSVTLQKKTNVSKQEFIKGLLSNANFKANTININIKM